MRLLHTADIHLGSPLRSQALRNPELGRRLGHLTRQALTRIVDLALEHRVDALLIAGDLFDDAVADVGLRTVVTRELARLARAGIPTVLIRGNHDALLDLDRYGPISDSVHLLHGGAPTVEIKDAAIHGIGFETRHAGESLLPTYPRPVPGRFNVGLMHTSLGGAEGHDPYAPCAEADLLAWGYEYWALGHIHRRSEHRAGGALAVMPGIPQGRHVREPGRGSATLVTLDGQGARAEALPVAGLAFAEVEIDVSGAETQEAALARLAAALAPHAQAEHEVALRILLRGAAHLDAEPGQARALAEAAAADAPTLFIDSVRLLRDRAVAAPGVVRELAAMMAEVAGEPGFRDEMAAALGELRAALPPEARAALPDTALDELLREGVEKVAARLAAGARSP